MSSNIVVTSTPTPTPTDSSKKTFWDKYGKIITGFGYGLAGILLIVVIYLASRKCDPVESQLKAVHGPPSYGPPSYGPPSYGPPYYGPPAKGGGKGRGLAKTLKGITKNMKKSLKKGGCGCTGISSATP
jgi:hypothetical protein